MNGEIKDVVVDRGFGFIRDGNGVEWFFHRTDVKPHKNDFQGLRARDRVTFEPSHNEKGPKAANVRKV